MDDTRTPGQIGYEAYRLVVLPTAGRAHLPPWTHLPALSRAGWEAAAQAVLTMQEEEDTFRFTVGQCVTWDEAPGAFWEVAERLTQPCHLYALLPAAGDRSGFRPMIVAETHLEAVEEDTP
jgi:hypothetical protein